MIHWEYTELTLRIMPGQGKVPGYFTRSQRARSIAPDSLTALNELGSQGWELVNILLLEIGSMGSGPDYACAVLKRMVTASSGDSTPA